MASGTGEKSLISLEATRPAKMLSSIISVSSFRHQISCLYLFPHIDNQPHLKARFSRKTYSYRERWPNQKIFEASQQE